MTAASAQGLDNALNRATTTPPPLTGRLALSADTLTVTSPLLSDLSLFLSTQAAIETVLLLLFVSLTVVGATVILLAARMIVARRDAELTMLRARGGSLRQVAALLARAAVLAAGPAAVIGVGLATALVPGAGSSPASGSGWPLAGIAVLAALAGPPLVAVWHYRRPAPASNPARVTSAETGRPGRAWRRPVAEVTAIAASVAGLVVLRNQGVSAPGSGGGADLYLTLTPVLVAIPVVVVMLRLYPLAVRGLLAVCARGAGATGFVALSRAARSSLTGVLPAFALVLALSLATFAGMVSNGITQRRDRRLLAYHRGGRADRTRRLLSPGQFRRGAGDRRGPRRASRHRGLEHELGHAVRPADHGGRGGPGQLRGRGRGHAVSRLRGGQDRHRDGRHHAL